MNLSLVEKKCTVDYLERLIPKQRAALTGIIDGGLQDVEGQVETIEYTLQFIDKGKEANNYDSILKVLKFWIDKGRGHIQLDRLQEELRESILV